MKNISRRNFLKNVGAASLVAQAGILGSPLRAAMGNFEKYPPSLVCIYLRGGADWLNMVIPYKDKDYMTVRPTLAMGEEHGVIKLDGKWGLHPALGAFDSLFKEKLLAPIVAVGSPHTTRSHFDAQDFMEFGAPGDRTVRTGWLNRYLVETEKKSQSEFRSMAMQEILPRSLRGNFPVLAVPSGMSTKKGAKTLDRFEEFYGGSGGGMDAPGGEGMPEGGAAENDPTGIVQSGRVTIDTLRRFQEIVGSVKSEAKYPKGRFAQRMESIAKVMKSGEGMEVAGVDYNGWDHHTGQGGMEGRQATMLKDLSDCIAAFCRDMGLRMSNTTVIVMTEFGRTVSENGNGGTDHGHGGGAFVIGGGVKGGKVHGSWKGLKTEALYEGRDLQVTTDFRDLFHSVLHGTFGFKCAKGFFPAYGSRKISGLY